MVRFVIEMNPEEYGYYEVLDMQDNYKNVFGSFNLEECRKWIHDWYQHG